MNHSDFGKAREKSPWLALSVALLIALASILATMIWSAESRALNPEQPVANIGLASGDYSSPQQCRECHEEQFAAWSNTTHANASFDPVFQVALEQAAEPGECFACHTTGYDTTTGHFMLSGVTCEACHGPYRPEHPEESMTIAGSEELCGTCHTNTLAEWRSSLHYDRGVTCTACHEVHTQKTRASDSTNTLCANCHPDQIQDGDHSVHLDAGVYCVECHMAQPESGAADGVKSRTPTGHAFAVYVDACDDCHPLMLGSTTLEQK
jgi:hypothetical protein